MTKKKNPGVANIFDHLSNINYNKKAWDEYSDADKKTWNNFLISRWLSMEVDYIEIVNYLQKYVLGAQMKPKIAFDLYKNILPKRKVWNKYVGAKKTKKKKYNAELIEFITKYYEVSKFKASQYIDTFLIIEEGRSDIQAILEYFGVPEEKIKKIMP